MEDNDTLKREIGEIINAMNNNKENKLMMITKATNRTMVNILLLHHFLNKEGASGVFITFDRPHQYIKKILEIQGIDHSNLTFIDAISMISGETVVQGDSSILFMNGPYRIPLFHDLVARCYSNDRHKKQIDLKEMSFIMIDDISALSLYNKDDTVRKFIRDFLSHIDPLDAFIVSFALDDNYNKELYTFIKEYCDTEVFINPDENVIIHRNQKPTKTIEKGTSHSRLKNLVSRRSKVIMPSRGKEVII